MIYHYETYRRSNRQYPSGPIFIRRRYFNDSLFLYAKGVSGPCIGLCHREKDGYPWKVFMGPFCESGQKKERSFKSFRNAVKLFRSLGRQALEGKITGVTNE